MVQQFYSEDAHGKIYAFAGEKKFIITYSHILPISTAQYAMYVCTVYNIKKNPQIENICKKPFFTYET